jgi:hypothetical protein
MGRPPKPKPEAPAKAGKKGNNPAIRNLSLVSQPPWSVKCSRGKWDATKIGTKNTDGISKAIFNRERSKCDFFIEYNKYAGQEAPKESEEMKRVARKMRITWTLSIIAILIALCSLAVAFGSLVIAWLTYLKIRRYFQN